MGMTDRQFDSYQARLLDQLIRIQTEVKEQGSSPELEKLIASITSELKRP